MRTPLLPLPRPRVAGALALSIALAMLFLLAALGFAPANAATRRGDRDSRATRSADFEWNERMREGQTLEVRGINGAIEARAASGSEARVTAVKKGRRCDPDEVRIEVSRTDEGIVVCAIYPGRNGDGACRDLDGDGRGTHDDDWGDRGHRNCDVSVAFTVDVPAGVAFKPRTVNGGIQVDELDGEVHAETVNGSVQIETHDVASAQTVNGSIQVEMGKARWDGDLEFHTVNGSITLHAPARLSGKVTAVTMNGRIESDFPFSATSASSRRRITGTIGDGGRGTMRLETLNGSIHLVQR